MAKRSNVDSAAVQTALIEVGKKTFKTQQVFYEAVAKAYKKATGEAMSGKQVWHQVNKGLVSLDGSPVKKGTKTAKAKVKKPAKAPGPKPVLSATKPQNAAEPVKAPRPSKTVEIPDEHVGSGFMKIFAPSGICPVDLEEVSEDNVIEWEQDLQAHYVAKHKVLAREAVLYFLRRFCDQRDTKQYEQAQQWVSTRDDEGTRDGSPTDRQFDATM